jgi:hypothetical protein
MTPEIQLTDEELKAAGKRLCQIRGLNPYLMVGTITLTDMAMAEIKRLMEIIQAIDHVKEIP